MRGFCLLSWSVSIAMAASSTRMLFVGNSFTFVNDMPKQLEHIASSLGHSVETHKSVIGGCTLFAQEQAWDNTTKKLLAEEWDFIVLQDFSMLPTVKAARAKYLAPAIQDFLAHKKRAKVVMYMTWGYHDGYQEDCPTSDTPACFPLGTLANLTSPPCGTSDEYKKRVGSFECMGYSLARGYLSTLSESGPDMVAPCGLAWQIARGSTKIPSDCKALVDAEYDTQMSLKLPLSGVDGAAVPSRVLNIVNKDGSYDKHPNEFGQYLNALVMFATIFGRSPVNAAGPVASGMNWGVPPTPLSSAEQHALQLAATAAVQQCGAACQRPAMVQI